MYEGHLSPRDKISNAQYGWSLCSDTERNERTVEHVDDAAQIHMRWDNGRTLAIIPEEDDFRKLTAEELAEENEDMDEDNAPVMGMWGAAKII